MPLCLVAPLTVALVQGDLKSMFTYRDHEELTESTKTPNASLNTETEAVTTGQENYVPIGNSPKSKKDKKKN